MTPAEKLILRAYDDSWGRWAPMHAGGAELDTAVMREVAQRCGVGAARIEQVLDDNPPQ
jgi:hypothetical protein